MSNQTIGEKNKELWLELDRRAAEIVALRRQLAEAQEELSIWKSVFPDIAPASVLPPPSGDAWDAIMEDPQLQRARSKLSIHEIRLIIAHVRRTPEADARAYMETMSAARARVETLEAALKSFLHLTKGSDDDDAGTDALTDLPDSHPFELTWGSDGRGYPQITVGQIKRARAALSGKE